MRHANEITGMACSMAQKDYPHKLSYKLKMNKIYFKIHKVQSELYRMLHC